MKFAMHSSREVTKVSKHQFSPKNQYISYKKTTRINDHQRENTLIFYQIPSTFSSGKCMRMSLENVNWLKLKGLCHGELI